MCLKNTEMARCQDDGKDMASFRGSLYWNPFSLTFPSASNEQWFRSIAYPAWHIQDFGGHCIGLVIAPIMLYAMNESLPWWYTLLWLFLSYVWAPMHIYIYLKHRELMERTRFWNVVALRIMTSAICSGLGCFLRSPKPSIGAVLMTLLTKSPSAGMFYISLVHRVEFRRHLVIQFVALLIGLLWIPSFCSTCSNDVNVMNRFQQMGYGIDALFSFFVPKIDPVPMWYPCWMLSVLLTSIIGFILPTLFVFISEVSSRAMFVRSRVPQKMHGDVLIYANDAMKVGILAGLCAVVGCWFFLQPGKHFV